MKTRLALLTVIIAASFLAGCNCPDLVCGGDSFRLTIAPSGGGLLPHGLYTIFVEYEDGASETLESTPDVYVEVHVNEGLETYGHGARDVLSFFSPARYATYVCPRGDEDFVPVENADASLFERMFLLVALSKDR